MLVILAYSADEYAKNIAGMATTSQALRNAV